MTYGYNASLIDGSRGTVRTLARGFLENIDGEREKEGVSRLSYLTGIF